MCRWRCHLSVSCLKWLQVLTCLRASFLCVGSRGTGKAGIELISFPNTMDDPPQVMWIAEGEGRGDDDYSGLYQVQGLEAELVNGNKADEYVFNPGMLIIMKTGWVEE